MSTFCRTNKLVGEIDCCFVVSYIQTVWFQFWRTDTAGVEKKKSQAFLVMMKGKERWGRRRLLLYDMLAESVLSHKVFM